MTKFQRSPLALPLVFFICGIGVPLYIFLFFLAMLLLLLIVLWHYQKLALTLQFGSNLCKSLSLYLLFFLGGCLIKEINNEENVAIKGNVSLSFAQVKFSNSVRYTSKGAWTTAQLLLDTLTLDVQVNLDSARANILERGDTLDLQNIKLYPLVKEGKVASGFEEYLKRQGVVGKLYVNEYSFVRIRKNSSWKYSIYNRLHAKILKSKLSKGSKSLLLSLLIGDRGYIDKTTKDSFSALGVSHILSVSGLHVGIIYLILAFFISSIWNKHAYISLASILTFIWFYCWMVGFEAAVLRSALMFSLYAIGNAIGRKSNLLHTTALSALIILSINPSFLYDIGFQLTYGAMLGIIYIMPILQRKVHCESTIVKSISDLILLSLAVQITLLPLLIYHFQSLSVYFMVANLVVVPTVALIMYAGILFLSIPENEILNFIVDVLVMINDSCCAWMCKWPYTILYINNISLIDLSYYSIIVINVIFYETCKLNAFLWIGLLSLLTLII
jgi:ComEC/Rec2-related protein